MSLSRTTPTALICRWASAVSTFRGQRQSVEAGAGAAGKSLFLLLDEPSNSMDNGTEELLKRKLAADIEGKTLLLVTHRASLLDLVDRLIVLESGESCRRMAQSRRCGGAAPGQVKRRRRQAPMKQGSDSVAAVALQTQARLAVREDADYLSDARGTVAADSTRWTIDTWLTLFLSAQPSAGRWAELDEVTTEADE